MTLAERHAALLKRVTVLERALERVERITSAREGEFQTLDREWCARIARKALAGEGYRDLDHYDRARDERAEGLHDDQQAEE